MDACLAACAKQCCREQTAHPGQMLEGSNFVEGVERDCGCERWRQRLGGSRDVLPFAEPRRLIPIEIIDQRVTLYRMLRGGACELSIRLGHGGVDGGERLRKTRIVMTGNSAVFGSVRVGIGGGAAALLRSAGRLCRMIAC